MPALNYAQQYSQALAQAYPYVLHFAALRSTENDARYKWTGANTIQIPSLSTTGRVDGDRDTITVAKRNFDNAWEPKTLGNFRTWSTLVHPMDIDETNQVASIQNITQVFNEEQKFPEMDAYLVSKLYADWVAAGMTADTTALTEQNILQVFDGYMVAMDEANVPKVGRILYLTPAINKILKNAADLARTIMNGDENIRRTVKSLDEVTIESVPSALMKTVYDFTEGWTAGEGAKQINMLLAHPSAVITPEKYTFAQLDPPSAGSNGKWVYFEESYDDTFLLNKRKNAIKYNVDA
ncbi:MAG: capsid protein [Oscillospiraceae bacterium]|nr:capsid protein [Oscillospiraceae bacterium]